MLTTKAAVSLLVAVSKWLYAGGVGGLSDIVQALDAILCDEGSSLGGYCSVIRWEMKPPFF